MTTPNPRAAQLIIASAFIKHSRANHPAPFGDCRNPECWRGYRLLMRLWPDMNDWFSVRQPHQSELARFEIANKVSATLPLTCWLDWASWALGMHPVQENDSVSGCHIADKYFIRGGGCYCGKHRAQEVTQ